MKEYTIQLDGFPEHPISSYVDMNDPEWYEDAIYEYLGNEIDFMWPAFDECLPKGDDFSTSIPFDEVIRGLRNRDIRIMDENGQIVHQESMSTREEFLLDCMNGEFYDLTLWRFWIHQMRKFIEQGEWMFGLKDGDLIDINVQDWPKPQFDEEGNPFWMKGEKSLQPIVWFGLKGECPSSFWKLSQQGIAIIIKEEDDKEHEGKDIYFDGLKAAYGRVFPDWSSQFFDWGYDECENGADFTKVIESCPIDFAGLYNNGSVTNGEEKSDENFLNSILYAHQSVITS